MKAILDVGSAGRLFNVLDTRIYEAVVGRPMRTVCPLRLIPAIERCSGSVEAGTNSVEHGSMRA